MNYPIYSTITDLADLPKEIWAPIYGHEDSYLISNLGRVKSLGRVIIRKNGLPLPLKERILRCGVNSNGYHCVGLSRNGLPDSRMIYKLVADHFIGNPHNKPCVNHINGIKLQSCVYNLEHVTYKENCQHAYLTGLNNAKAGTLNGMCKLSESEVIEISQSKDTCNNLAIKYKVSDVQISNIKNGTSWSHITKIEKKDSRLSKEIVLDIKNSKESAAFLSKKHNTSVFNIWNIRKGKTFSKITGLAYSPKLAL